MALSFSEKICEARKIAQKPRLLLAGSWYSKYVMRRFSIYFSYFFWKVGVSANALTVASGVAGLLGSLCIALDNPRLTLLGAVLWQIWFLLDDVDGEVARLRSQPSLLGAYLDELTHILVNPTFCLALGIHVCLKSLSAINILATIILYVSFTATRQIKRVAGDITRGRDVEQPPQVSAMPFQVKSPRFWLRFSVAQCFTEIGQMYLIPAVILLDVVIARDITSAFLYLYALLFVAYMFAFVIRGGCTVRKADRERSLPE